MRSYSRGEAESELKATCELKAAVGADGGSEAVSAEVNSSIEC